MTKQCEKLLNYMMIHGSVTGMESINKLGVLNYKGRIFDLRKLGYTIETKYETRINSLGEEKTFARYILKGVQSNANPG